jgi:phosphate:Na+ symporter
VGIKNRLIALVFFQSLVNVIGIILFYPFLKIFAGFLEKQYRNTEEETMFIHKVDARESSMALFALREESGYFLEAVLDFARECFELMTLSPAEKKEYGKYRKIPFFEKYEHLKFLYGEIHTYYIAVQKNITDKEETEKLDRLMSSVRNAMYAAKSFKDSLPDKNQLFNSSNEIKYNFYRQSRQEVDELCNNFQHLLAQGEQMSSGDLAKVYKQVTSGYTNTLQQLYRESTAGHVNETEITTMLNFNREIFTAFKSMLFALKDYGLDKDQSKFIEEQPGFIR